MSAEMQKTILLVDDEAIIAMATKMTLEKYGYEVLISNTGEKAVETVEKTPAIDLILMDINLGAGIDGSETAVIILQKRDLPIVFLSGHTEPEVVAKTEKITSYGYVVKNSGDTVLQASIRMAFKLFASNEEIRKSKERQQLILATLPIAIFTSPLDPEIDASWISGDVEKVTGFTVEQYMAEKDFWRNRLHADDRERVLAAYRNPAAGDEIVLEYRWLCKDGNYKWFYDRAIKKRTHQEVQYFGIILDITERKREEEKLQKLASVVSHASELINMSTPDGRMIFLNEAGSEMLGISPDELNQTNIMQVIPAHLKDKVEKELLPALFNSGKWSGEMQYVNMKTGQLRDFLSTTFAIKDPGTEKTLYLANVSTDITERKRVESQREAALEDLRKNEEKYRGLTENINLGIYRNTVGPEGRFIEANPAIIGMFGYKSREEFLAVNVSELYQNPEDRNKFNAKMLKEGFVRGEELWLKRKDGSFFIGSVSAVAVKDERGQVKYYDGIIDNIDDHKRAESQSEAVHEALRQSEALYQALVETSPDAIVLSDLNGTITMMNQQLATLHGYENKEELMGKCAFELFAPEDSQRAIDNMGRAMEAGPGESKKFECVLLKKDGTRFWGELYGKLILYPNEKSPLMLTIVRDISERKQAEEEIKRQLAEKEILLKEVHHRIKNNIASIGGLLSLHMQSATNPEALTALQAANGRVNSMGILYDKLLLSESYKDISVKNYLNELIDTIIAIFPEKAKVTVKKQIIDFHLDPKRLFPLGSIINELLTNAMKYAFIDRDTGLIKIVLKKEKNHVTLTIQDDGNGLPAGFDINKAKGFGLMLVKMLSQQLEGSFSIKKHEGTRCKIEFSI